MGTFVFKGEAAVIDGKSSEKRKSVDYRGDVMWNRRKAKFLEGGDKKVVERTKEDYVAGAMKSQQR